MTCSYKTEITIEVTNTEIADAVTVRISKNQISITSPKIENNSPWYAEINARRVLAAVARARRVHRRVFGTRAP